MRLPGRDRSGAATAAVIAAVLVLPSCKTSPRAAHFELQPEAPKYRAAQTRYFETTDSKELLSASAAVLQDLGFGIEESVRELGFLRAAKERSAREHGQEVLRGLFMVLSSAASAFGGDFYTYIMPIDLHQKIAATLVARPLDEKGTRQEVRVMFYRVVWKGDGQNGRDHIAPGEQRMEMVHDPEIYQQFFACLAKAVFLEAHAL